MHASACVLMFVWGGLAQSPSHLVTLVSVQMTKTVVNRYEPPPLKQILLALKNVFMANVVC